MRHDIDEHVVGQDFLPDVFAELLQVTRCGGGGGGGGDDDGDSDAGGG